MIAKIFKGGGIYADHNATSPASEQVRDKMLPFLAEKFGNPSSLSNVLGQEARAAIEDARAQLALLIDAKPEEVIFLSGGTESCFQAIFGSLLANKNAKKILTSKVEHPCVLEALSTAAEFREIEQIQIGVDNQGNIDIGEVESLLKQNIFLLSIQAANNETGAVAPIEEISNAAKKHDTLVHTDAVQFVGKNKFSFRKSKIDLLSISAHKIGGPKGVGALIVRQGCAWRPVIPGGGQEGGQRGGTEAVALIVGFGQAAEERRLLLEANPQTNILRDKFEKTLIEQLGLISINARKTQRLPNTSSLIIEHVSAADLIQGLSARGIIVSAGSACKTSSGKPSHVLTAMGLSERQSRSTIRVSFAMDVEEEEVERLATEIVKEVNLLRAQSKRELKDIMQGQ